MKKRKRRGRPTRAEASRSALVDTDIDGVDPKTVLRTIAADISAPASARVAAAKALLADMPHEETANEKITNCALAFEGRQTLSDADNPKFPIAEIYKGIGIEADQPPERIEKIKAQIDEIHALADVKILFSILKNGDYAPEARIFSGTKIEAMAQLAAERRQAPPAGADLKVVGIILHGLQTTWRDFV